MRFLCLTKMHGQLKETLLIFLRSLSKFEGEGFWQDRVLFFCCVIC